MSLRRLNAMCGGTKVTVFVPLQKTVNSSRNG